MQEIAVDEDKIIIYQDMPHWFLLIELDDGITIINNKYKELYKK